MPSMLYDKAMRHMVQFQSPAYMKNNIQLLIEDCSFTNFDTRPIARVLHLPDRTVIRFSDVALEVSRSLGSKTQTRNGGA